MGRWVGVVLAAWVLGAPAAARAGGAKYYFQVRDVQGQGIDDAFKAFAGEALRAELKGRPEFTDEVAAAGGEEALAAELGKRKLRGFKISLRVDAKRQIKEPKPGGRLKRIEVDVKLRLFATDIPGDKIAFGGDGEAGAESEASDKGIDKEGDSLIRDAAKEALKQAVEQAVMKLSMPQASPQSKKGKGGKSPAKKGGP